MEHKQELGHKEPKLKISKVVDSTQQQSCSSSTSSSDHDAHHKVTGLGTNCSGDGGIGGSDHALPLVTTTTTAVVVEGEQDVSFFHDFIAGGIAGSASVIVGHPMDTVKVRMQTSTCGSSMWSLATGYGGLPGLYRGLAAPLSTACIINAIIFSSYGMSSRLYDEYFPPKALSSSTNGGSSSSNVSLHDSTLKAFTCGSFAGLVQALVICPQEHVKCRLQIQHGRGSPDHLYTGPVQATQSIIKQSGFFSGLYRGWCITCWREVPAFGAYFAFYDIFKDQINSYFVNRAQLDQQHRHQQQQQQHDRNEQYLQQLKNHDGTSTVVVAASVDVDASMAHHSHTWISSALAGGLTGALTWLIIYPFDVIKTHIQTMPLDTPIQDRRITTVTRTIIERSGWQHLFRGLTVTCLRAFPVNGIIFPVYEYSLMHLCALEY
jgi:solute carrier family 25 carnitine/acylcarnitine transporter 20/29